MIHYTIPFSHGCLKSRFTKSEDEFAHVNFDTINREISQFDELLTKQIISVESHYNHVSKWESYLENSLVFEDEIPDSIPVGYMFQSFKFFKKKAFEDNFKTFYLLPRWETTSTAAIPPGVGRVAEDNVCFFIYVYK